MFQKKSFLARGDSAATVEEQKIGGHSHQLRLVAGGKDSVIMRRGRPATKRMKQLVKRIARAEAALECTRVLMGPEMDDNIIVLG